MKKVLKHLRKVSEEVTIELQKKDFSYKVAVLVDGGMVYGIEGNDWKEIKKALMSKEVEIRIKEQLVYDGVERDKSFKQFLRG